MLKKTIRRLGALAMVLAMAVSVFAVNASATSYNLEQKGEITKKITKEENVLAPSATFKFQIATVGNAPSGGLYFMDDNNTLLTETTISSSPDKDRDIGHKEVTVGSEKLYVHIGAFDQPGFYDYTITEEAGAYESKDKYSDSYSAITKKVRVTIIREVNEEGNESLKVASVVFFKDEKELDTGDAKSNGEYVNDYSSDHDTQKDLIVTKKVTGKMGDYNQKFPITIKITPANSGKQFYLVCGDTNAIMNKNTDGTHTYTVYLKHNDVATVYGVSNADTVEVTEDLTGITGYQCVSIVDGTTTDKKEDKTVTVTNNATTNPPTGVIMTIAPYALMVVLAGAFAVVFLTRRNRAE